MSDPAPAHAQPAAFTCANCGHENTGGWCTACGQKQIHAGDLGLRHAWHHVTHELLHVDGKIFNSLRLLLTRPGQLTLDFVEGRRARHVHPIRIFLIVGAVFFLLARVNSPFDVSMTIAPQLNPEALESIDRRAEQLGVTRAEIMARAAATANDAYKPLSLVVTLLSGLVLWLLFRGRRPYLAENLVMTLHLASFNMLAWFVLGWFVRMEATRTIASLGLTLAIAGYFLFAARRVYGGGWFGLFLKWLAVELFKGVLVFVALSYIWAMTLRGP